jgi:predicted histone-like DNA-binding protein
MTMKVKAIEKKIKFDKESEGVWRYVMQPDLYTSLTQAKVIKEAALRSGVSRGVMQACWDAAGEVIKAWATEGHAVALPGLGTMRFGLRAKSVASVNDVKAALISSRRIIFTPASDLKEELSKTSVQITCFDRNGVEVKRVISGDEGKVEDPEDDGTTDSGNDGTTDNSGSTDSGNGGSTENPSAGGSFTIAAGVGSDGGGSVTIKKNGTAVAGNSVEATGSDTVVIEAVPENDNFQFMSWSDGSSQNPRTIQPSADMNLEASFMDLSKI